MSRSCGSKRYIFKEAIDHCRWKKVLRNNVLVKTEFQEHNLHQFTGKSFNEILLFVYNICVHVNCNNYSYYNCNFIFT